MSSEHTEHQPQTGAEPFATGLPHDDTPSKEDGQHTAAASDWSFVSWYRREFRAIIALPFPLNLVCHIALWLFYGFVWIPLWYLIGLADASLSSAPRYKAMSSWYKTRFRLLSAPPPPINVILHLLVWTFYGFIWIPLWYLLDVSQGKSAPSEIQGVSKTDTAPKRWSRMAVAGLVCAVVSLFASPSVTGVCQTRITEGRGWISPFLFGVSMTVVPALLLNIVSLRRIRKPGAGLKGIFLAVLGIVLTGITAVSLLGWFGLLTEEEATRLADIRDAEQKQIAEAEAKTQAAEEEKNRREREFLQSLPDKIEKLKGDLGSLRKQRSDLVQQIQRAGRQSPAARTMAKQVIEIDNRIREVEKQVSLIEAVVAKQAARQRASESFGLSEDEIEHLRETDIVLQEELGSGSTERQAGEDFQIDQVIQEALEGRR